MDSPQVGLGRSTDLEMLREKVFNRALQVQESLSDWQERTSSGFVRFAHVQVTSNYYTLTWWKMSLISTGAVNLKWADHSQRHWLVIRSWKGIKSRNHHRKSWAKWIKILKHLDTLCIPLGNMHWWAQRFIYKENYFNNVL